MVLGGRRNILINKDCYSASKTTNQAVGGSTPSGRAIFQFKNKRVDVTLLASFSALVPDCANFVLTGTRTTVFVRIACVVQSVG